MVEVAGISTTQEICKLIMNGVVDDYLEEISTTITRRKKMNQPSIYEFRVGDRVKFISTVRPQYLAGIVATVTGYTRTKITVELDYTVGRYRQGSKITTPVSIIRKV